MMMIYKFFNISKFSLFLYLLYKIKQKKSSFKKIKISFLIFILWIFSNQIFLLFSPDFRFYLTPVTKQYKNKDWTLNDIDKYIKLVNKYCAYNWPFNYKLMWRYSMCASNKKFEWDLKTVDEYIKVLESANKNNFDFLYSLTIEWLFRSEIVEEVIEKYNDDTFFSYLLLKYWRKNEVLTLVENNILNDEFKKIIEFYKEWLKDYNFKKLSLDPFKSDELYKILKWKTINKLIKIDWINKDLIY